MIITTKMLTEIRRLNEAEMNDAEISEALGLKYDTVRYHRIKEGLPSRRQKYRNRFLKRYCVYDARTTEFLLEGTAAECAARLGLTVGYIYIIVTKTKQGKTGLYEIHAA